MILENMCTYLVLKIIQIMYFLNRFEKYLIKHKRIKPQNEYINKKHVLDMLYISFMNIHFTV